MGRKQTFLSVLPNSNVEKQLVKAISIQVTLWQATLTKLKACKFVNEGQWSTILKTCKPGLLYGTCQQIYRRRFEYAVDPPRSLCSQKSRSSNKSLCANNMCLCASNVGWSQEQPNKTWAYSYNQKTNEQSSQWKSLSSSHTRETFHILVTCYYTIWFFSIVLQSLSHVFIYAQYCAWYLSRQLPSSFCKWAMTPPFS